MIFVCFREEKKGLEHTKRETTINAEQKKKNSHQATDIIICCVLCGDVYELLTLL